MSNSEFFLFKDDDQDGVLEFDILKSHDVIAAAAPSNDQESSSSSTSSADENVAVVKDGGGDTIKQGTCRLQKPRRLGEFNAAADDDDDDDDEGFKTPTAVDNQIPGIKQCPPAPRKPKPPLITATSTKRKLSSSSSSASSVSSNVRRRRLDLSQEVNSLFPKRILDDLHRKIKKARRDHHPHDQQHQEDEEN